jgi:hypothetical protein
MPITAGEPLKDPSLDQLELMDLPGRRSHEYFPELSSDGKWLIWAATQRGHDHDTADYEIYLWQVGSPSDQAVRLTHNSGNDRWPDLFLPSAAAAEPAPPAVDSAAAPASESPSNDAAATTPDSQQKLALSAKTDGQAAEKKKSKREKKPKAQKSEPAQP